VVTLGELAALLGLPPEDTDSSLELHDVAPLERAGPGDLAFLADRRFLSTLRETRAACVILKEEWADESPVPVLRAQDPYLAYARASSLFDRQSPAPMGVHPSAVVDPSAQVPSSASVGPGACLGPKVALGDDVVIGAGCYLGEGAVLGRGTRLAANVVIYHGVVLGEECRVHASTVIGSDGFGFARKPDGWEKIHQLGIVRIGDRVDIGAGVTIDRGALDDTVIEDDVIIDNQVHIAHNCTVGPRTAIAGCVGFAGSTSVGADCTFAGQVGVSGHLEICDNAHFTGQARVAKSIEEPGSYSSGAPLDSTSVWRRNAVRFSQLDALHRRVKALEKALEEALETTTTSPANNPAKSGAQSGEES